MQGKVGYRLQLENRVLENADLVDVGKSDVHVENVGAHVLLGDGLAQYIIDVAVDKRLLKALFTGGIYALSDYERHFRKLSIFAVGADTGYVFVAYRCRGDVICGGDGFFDVFGGGAAAAAENIYSELCNFGHLLGKAVGVEVIECPFAVAFGKSCVGFCKNRGRGVFKQLLYGSHELFGTERTVHSYGVHRKTFKKSHHGGRRCSGQQLAVLAVCVGGENRQIAVFLCRKHRCLGFIAVAHGFDEYKVGSVSRSEFNRVGENLHGTLKIKVSERL